MVLWNYLTVVFQICEPMVSEPAPQRTAEEAGGSTAVGPGAEWPPPGLCMGSPQHLAAAAAALCWGPSTLGLSFILSKKHVLKGWLLALLRKYWISFFSLKPLQFPHSRRLWGKEAVFLCTTGWHSTEVAWQACK